MTRACATPAAPTSARADGRLGRPARGAARRCSSATGSDGSNWDCIVPVSGGKDSTYQVIRMLQLGLNPLCVTATTCDLSAIGRAEHREHQAPGRRLRGVLAQPGGPRAAEPHRPDRGRRHLLAGARRHLHDPGARGGAVQRAADRLGRELAERVRRPGRGRREQRAHPALARGVRRPARAAGQRPVRDLRHRAAAPAALSVSERRGAAAGRRHRPVPRPLPALGRAVERADRAGVRLHHVSGRRSKARWWTTRISTITRPASTTTSSS